MARKILAIILAIGGGATLLIVVAHLLLGSAAIPGASAVNATVDSEDRFYAVIFGGYGFALLHAARDVEARAPLIRFLAVLFLAGAFARILSWIMVGPPHPFFMAMLALEFVLPVIILWLQASVTLGGSAAGRIEPGER